MKGIHAIADKNTTKTSRRSKHGLRAWAGRMDICPWVVCLFSEPFGERVRERCSQSMSCPHFFGIRPPHYPGSFTLSSWRDPWLYLVSDLWRKLPRRLIRLVPQVQPWPIVLHLAVICHMSITRPLPCANLSGCFPPATSSKGHHGPTVVDNQTPLIFVPELCDCRNELRTLVGWKYSSFEY